MIVIPGKVEEVWSWFKVHVFILVTIFLTIVCMRDRRMLSLLSEIETNTMMYQNENALLANMSLLYLTAGRDP